MKPSTLYLILYNVMQVLGWGTILIKTVSGLLLASTKDQLYKNVELELQIFQTAAILEIVHTIIGLVRSPLGTTLAQVFSRITVLWLILFNVASSRSSVGVPMLLLAWSLTEVVRYSYYALSLLKTVPFLLTWMRYTLFLVLYPLGASGEVITMISALPEIGEMKHLTSGTPDRLDFGLIFYGFVIFLCLAYIPGFPMLYGYMFLQRKKVLGKTERKQST
ncbi:protein tyrosine phosphatase-like protein, PTPLA domain-containing protein [Ditylenchus destructor]|uniref:Very-long-chain (3R)-3-hydroxyacyl-CoA dehydratase n=1 Tax=Ditylenchus destructor TaxID=166010 RepID=A0AAD4ML19_9BILA|nr:protein tyrosine phosphatase-like protein, PTPLA domain-containing protein [Ditylenchus destructor]